MSGQPGIMVYFDAESPAVRALSFVKEVSDGILDGLAFEVCSDPKSCVKNMSIIFLVIWVFKKDPGFLRLPPCPPW